MLYTGAGAETSFDRIIEPASLMLIGDDDTTLRPVVPDAAICMPNYIPGCDVSSQGHHHDQPTQADHLQAGMIQSGFLPK